MFDLIETNRKKQLWACWDAFPTAVIILGFGVLLSQQTAISNRPPGTAADELGCVLAFTLDSGIIEDGSSARICGDDYGALHAASNTTSSTA